MSKSVIGLGSSANDGTGDTLRATGAKINTTFTEVYSKLGDGTDLTSDTVVLVAATQTLSNKTLTAPVIGTSLLPASSGSVALGSISKEWLGLYLSDGAVIALGDDQDVTLTHVADTGLQVSSTDKIMFNDTSQFIHGSSATVLSIGATDEIDLTATTIDINGAVDIAGNSVLASVDVTGVATAATFEPDGDTAAGDNAAIGYTLTEGVVITGQGSTNDVTIKNDADADVIEIPTGTTNVTIAGTLGTGGAITGGGLLTTGGNIVIPNAGNIGSASDTDSIAIASNGVVTFSQAPVFPDGSIPLADLNINGATDIGADIVDADLFIIDDGAGGTNRKVAASRIATYIDAGLPRGYLSGMGLANATDTAHDITVGIGEVRDNANAADIILASAFTKRIDATWASGSGNGGLASGVSIATNTWYHVHAIIVSGSTDIGFDTSITAANLVANNSASAFRRIGAVLTDGSSNILNFIQDGDEFIFKAQIVNINATAIGTARVTQAVSAPLGVQTRAILGLVGQVANANNGVRVTLTHPDVTDATPTSQNANNAGENSSDNNGTFASGTHIVLTNTSSQIAIRQDYNSSLSMNTNGYYDRRGQG